MNLKTFLLGILLFTSSIGGGAITRASNDVSAFISLKVPGNDAQVYSLEMIAQKEGGYICEPSTNLPIKITRQVVEAGDLKRINVVIHALEDVYLNYGERLSTGYQHADCQFYMPGFWYRRNLRSPKEAPSFHTSDSWLVREDRLSSPLTAIFDPNERKVKSVMRIDAFEKEALTTHKTGEVILSGETSIGYTGFENIDGIATLSYGFPYKEEPRTYIRKLTLDPSVKAFQLLRKGDSLSLVWEIKEQDVVDFSDCVRNLWEYAYDTNCPDPLEAPYTAEYMKEILSHYFSDSYVSKDTVCYYSGVGLETATCESKGIAEIGFVGRTLLNAFNALEYGESLNREDLVTDAKSVFDTYLRNGFSAAGFFNELVYYDKNFIEPIHSIRRQSEGVYAILHYLRYEKERGRRHIEWEERVKRMLDMFLRLQNEDGSFPRKFKDDFSLVDKSGGSTPSATLPLVMGYKYFKDRRYLESAERTVDYLENELIAKADYFSSTLDANCEDKEASLAVATATYYMALASQGQEREHYAELCRTAAYFGLSWYYTWDVPFADGQMLGDIGLKTRGWGNVSVENNHIDVFVFDFVDVLNWLSGQYNEHRFSRFANVISTSLRQLLPYEGHLCGVAKPGYYPEVIQHTNWDYGKNGKGYYNDIFAPGWAVASLWELLTPGRAERFFMGL